MILSSYHFSEENRGIFTSVCRIGVRICLTVNIYTDLTDFMREVSFIMTETTVYSFTDGFQLGNGQFNAERRELPTPRSYDLLVQVAATAVNPVDTKLRQSLLGPHAHVLGYDGAGVILAKGDQVVDFQVGDQIYYSGTTRRPGSYATAQLIDSRLVAAKPTNLTMTAAAAMPLTTLTAWELLFERMGFPAVKNANAGRRLLIINGAGGVGSIMSQLAHWSGFSVAATASPKHFPWLQQHQVDLPLDYHQDLQAQLADAGWAQVDAVAILTEPTAYFALAAAVIAPLGHVGSIVESANDLPLGLLKAKSASWHWEYMFTKTDYQMELATQGQILARAAHLFTTGELRSNVATVLAGLSNDNLLTAHRLLETGHTQGKIVLQVI